MSALLSLASQHIPALSSELCESSLDLTKYTVVWRLLLRSLVASASPPVFYLLLSAACREAGPGREAELQQVVVAAIEAAHPHAHAYLAEQQNLLQVNCDPLVYYNVKWFFLSQGAYKASTKGQNPRNWPAGLIIS